MFSNEVTISYPMFFYFLI